jgi:tRNA(Ile)-lysidine synthase
VAVTPASVLARLRELAPTGPLRCVVAWSGGLDSTVLLHLLWRAARSPGAVLQLRAIHVDHGLQPAARHFRDFCRRTARQWRIPLQLLSSGARPGPGDSVEEVARAGRLRALADAVRANECLVVAQHADDQLETLLLAMLRGAGPAGLAGMPASLPFAGTRLLRPLLSSTRGQIAAYAAAQRLSWVEDPTNAEPRFDRNYLRTQVVPLLKARWPAAAATAVRGARHQAAAAAVVAMQAARDVEAAAHGADLAIPVLNRWTAARRAEALRAWLLQRGLRAPHERHISQIEAMMAARPDAHPLLQLPDGTIRRIGGRLSVTRTS